MAQRRFCAYEFSGLDPVTWVVGATGTTNTSASPNSGNVTSTVGPVLLVGVADYNSGGVAYSAGSTQGYAYNLLNDFTNASQNRMAAEYVIVQNKGTYSANGTITNTTWSQLFVMFKDAKSFNPLAAMGVG